MRKMFEATKKLYGDKPVVGVEIGTSAGMNAGEVLREWKEITKLFCVDFYPTYSDFRDANDQDSMRDICVANFTNIPRAHLKLGESVKVAEGFEKESVDFVYIDANHSYEFVKADILAWMPKIRKGGMIGGHDYDWTDLERNDELAVKKAVDEEFGDRVNYSVRVSIKDTEGGWKEFTLEEWNKIHEGNMSKANNHGHINSDWWVTL